MALLLKVHLLLLSDQGVLVAWRGQKKSMADHSGETDLHSGTESQRGTEIGIETGIERGTEVLEVGGVLLVMEEEAEVVIEWMGGTGSEAGRKMEAITGEEDGTETVIGTETAIGTETGGTGGRGEAPWIATENEGGVMMVRGSEGEGTEEKEDGEKEGAETEGEELKEKKGTGRGDRNGERGPRGGTEMIDWPNWKAWIDFGPLTVHSNLA